MADTIDGQQGIDVSIGNGPPKRAPCERRQNLAGTGVFFLRRGRLADKNPSAAGRIARTRDIVRSADRELGKSRTACALLNFEELEPAAIEPQIQVARRHRWRRASAWASASWVRKDLRHRIGPRECQPHVTNACFDRSAKFQNLCDRSGGLSKGRRGSGHLDSKSIFGVDGK